MVKPPLPTPVLRVDAAPGTSICRICYDQLDAEAIIHYELLRTETGQLRYVQRTADGLFESSYYNSQLKKVVPLGKFVDELTAALAHAIARSDRLHSSTPYMAQHEIERLFIASNAKQPDTPPLFPDSVVKSKEQGEEEEEEDMDMALWAWVKQETAPGRSTESF